MKLVTRHSMSKRALARLTVGIAAAEVPAAASGDVFESSCCRLLGWGKDPHAKACGFHILSAGSLPSPSTGWHHAGPAESQADSGELGGNGQEQTAVPGLLPLSINQHFSESQTWLCLWDISYEIQKLIQVGSFG